MSDPGAELKRLREENAALNEQVKLLVQTEQRLYGVRGQLDRQLSRIRALADFALACSRLEAPAEIMQRAAQLLLDTFNVDGVTTVDVGRHGLSLTAWPAGLEREVAVEAGLLEWVGDQARAVVLRTDSTEARERVAPLLRALYGDPCPDLEDLILVCLPLRDRGRLQGFVVASKAVGRGASYHKEHPGPDHEPFLQLLANHLDRALLNAALTSDLRERGRQLAEANRQLTLSFEQREQADREIARLQRLETAGRLAGQIAHDMNNLLAPLMGYPALLEKQFPDGHPSRPMVRQMEKAAHRIAEINQQLLALGRRGHYTMIPLDLNEVVEEVVRGFVPDEVVELRMDLDPALLSMKGGASQLSRVVTNLLRNAVEAMPVGGCLTVRTRGIYVDEELAGYKSIARGEFVRLDVSDTGSGIEPENVDRIFDPFFSTKEMDRQRGSGLGLSVVHGIVEDHGGAVTFETSVGQGTTFQIYFPVTRDERPAVYDTAPEQPGGTESLLLVDDDPLQLDVVTTMLSPLGYRIDQVSSGEQAVAAIEAAPRDLIVLDMVMDGIDGTETLRRIRELRPEQRVILVSGFARTERVREAQALGVSQFLAKPLTQARLAKAVRFALRPTADPSCRSTR